MQALDPVSLGIMWDRLISISNEMATTLVRTAFSSIVRESLDLAVVLFDAQGNTLAQSDFGAPGHSGAAPVTLRAVMDKFPPDTMRPGDLFITNDPWIGTGHMFDMTFVHPVFRGDTLVGYTFSDTHMPDIGGGGWSATGADMYHEGLHLPVVRLYKGGERNEELIDIIRTNVRVNDQVIGDIMANVSCHQVGARMLVNFMNQYGVDDLSELARLITEKSETAMRAEIAKIPDGTYRKTIQVDGWREPLTLALALTVKGDQVHLDFTGTSPVVDSGINTPLCYTRAMSIHAMRMLTVPDMPPNDGTVNPISFHVPENCILNAQPPCATGGRHIVGHFPTPMVFAALAEVLPERVQAESGMLNSVPMQGVHRNGKPIGTMYFASGGYGALHGKDGIATIPSPANMRITPAEVWEHLTSMKIEHKRLLPDSGGAGEFRGGLGQEIVMRNTTGSPIALSFFGRQIEFPPEGMNGGRPGRPLQYLVDGKPAPPTGRAILPPDGLLTIIMPGGGGYGAPDKRTRAAMQADLRDRFVTREGLQREYGVSL